MRLIELLQAVRDQNLTKTQLEDYHSEMTHLHSDMQIALADIEKQEAIYFYSAKEEKPEESDVSIKRRWKATPSGLREIELNRYIKATAKELNSLKSRLFSIY